MSGASDSTKWREDFPTEWEADNYVTRREFTKFLVLASAATFLGNGYFVLRGNKAGEKYPRVDIGEAAAVAPGESRLFRYPTQNDPAILLGLADGAFVAYLQRCTHLSCPVQFRAESHTLECPCHNGSFDAATGEVLSGPPPRPLPRIRLELQHGRIFATGLEVQS